MEKQNEFFASLSTGNGGGSQGKTKTLFTGGIPEKKQHQLLKNRVISL